MINLNSLPESSQKLLTGILCLITVLIIISVLVITPLKNAEENKNRLIKLKGEVSQIEKLLSEYKALPKPLKKVGGNVSLLASIETITLELSIKKKMGQIKSLSAEKNKEGADVKFNNLSGSELTKLLLRLRQENIAVIKARFRDNDLDGLWNVSLILEG